MRHRKPLLAVMSATLLIGLTGCPDPTTSSNNPTPSASPTNTASSSVHEGTISSNETWTKAQSPHIVRGELYVESTNGATLTIEPGAEVRFEAEAGLYFGWSNGQSGTLKAEGTSTESITFTSVTANKAKGDWKQIWIGTGGAATVLKHCVIKYGGGDGNTYGHSVLNVYGAAIKPTLENCTFEENNGSAINLENDASFTSFQNNTIKTSQKSAIVLSPEAVDTLGTGNSFTSNGLQAIEVLADRIDKNVRWRNQGIPYKLLGDITVEGSNSPTLTLDPGCTLQFTAGANMYVGGTFGGALYAKGTNTGKITFTSVPGNATPGAWNALEFDTAAVPGSASDPHSCYLENVLIEYGGGNGGTTRGSVMIYDSKPYFVNVTVKDSMGYGVYVEGTPGTTIPLTSTGLGTLVFAGSIENAPDFIRYPTAP